jgi:hypothetical protein
MVKVATNHKQMADPILVLETLADQVQLIVPSLSATRKRTLVQEIADIWDLISSTQLWRQTYLLKEWADYTLPHHAAVVLWIMSDRGLQLGAANIIDADEDVRKAFPAILPESAVTVKVRTNLKKLATRLMSLFVALF